jgi:hypothetical protein
MHFGVAVGDITPPFPASMGGYGNRAGHYERAGDPLTVTAVVLAEYGCKAVIVTVDIVEYSRYVGGLMMNRGDSYPDVINRHDLSRFFQGVAAHARWFTGSTARPSSGRSAGRARGQTAGPGVDS